MTGARHVLMMAATMGLVLAGGAAVAQAQDGGFLPNLINSQRPAAMQSQAVTTNSQSAYEAAKAQAFKRQEEAQAAMDAALVQSNTARVEQMQAAFEAERARIHAAEAAALAQASGAAPVMPGQPGASDPATTAAQPKKTPADAIRVFVPQKSGDEDKPRRLFNNVR